MRPNQSFKGTYGKVTLVGGNKHFGGAIIMASSAAVYSGAGLVTTVSDMANLSSLHARLPEAMIADVNDPKQVKALIQPAKVVVIGSGLGTDAHSQQILKEAFDAISPKQIVVIDGSAITLVALKHIPLPKAHLIFTPHQVEWQRLSGIKLADQGDIAKNQKARDRIGGIVVLKSHHTQIYSDKPMLQNPIGTPAQATGGMGDTLAGMVGGFCAQFSNSLYATASAVYAHSDIADHLAQNQYVVLPTQIISHIPQYMKRHEARR
ncbi:NAD(P)H-hydrate dehydratase [Acetilactobacillus jinshanensis]|uniref:NAD(P)H-hydrate dehydratase n=1 Tax=Acetilactobacillus jinshanensis TaxID=1720083 RepID=UPI00300726F8